MPQTFIALFINNGFIVNISKLGIMSVTHRHTLVSLSTTRPSEATEQNACIEGSRSSSSSDSEDEDEEIGSDEESGMLLHSPSTFNHQLKFIDSTPREPLQ